MTETWVCARCGHEFDDDPYEVDLFGQWYCRACSAILWHDDEEDET